MTDSQIRMPSQIDRRSLLRAGAAGLALVPGMALLNACSPSPSPSRNESKTLRYALTDPRDPNVDPGSVVGVNSVILGFCLYEGLASFTPVSGMKAGSKASALQNSLAEEFELSKDGLRLKFKLKQGVEFHGGFGELTANDVRFSFERVAGKTGEELAYAGDWLALDRVNVTGKYEGEVTLTQPYAPLLTTTIPWFAGWIVSEKAMKERGKDFSTNPIGTGPYEWAEWVPQQRVVLRRFENWHGDATPDWEEIRLEYVSDQTAQATALEAGSIDAGRLSVDKVKTLSKRQGLKVASADSLDQIWLGMNLDQPKLKDRNVREAIRYAVDVPAILDGAYDGLYAQATGTVAPGMPVGYWSDAPKYKRDVERAKGLLKTSGAESLDLTLTVSKDTEFRLIAEIVQASLAEVGINVKIDVRSDLVSLGKAARELELFIGSFSFVPPDPVWATQWWRCDQRDQYNWMYWCDEEYDRLDRQAVEVVDPAKRGEIYIEEQKVWDAAAHSVWLAWPTVYVGLREGLEPSWLTSIPYLPNFRRSGS
ncbi:ABC transporter substrate-binding protein [Paenarthrobacter sp. A20]|uniref:ABC transporter substrate-binding protein n=1 Tax=Paenarthrobacter sp. A20 TaxID=2817891 RepID=UPI00209EF9A7|nr:ABC transporter substrate-binding protein [Paenarthrobacter sp. A20]MCP1415617.1 peptide/nickel transport system substrate-binding protein [Paenarthrobacter sp. A20]